MRKIWSSRLTNELKTKIFRATVEPILLYRSETYTLSRKHRKSQRHIDSSTDSPLKGSKSLMEEPSNHSRRSDSQSSTERNSEKAVIGSGKVTECGLSEISVEIYLGDCF